MINTINQRQRFPFWCHSCQRETFPTENESGNPVCGFCRNTFIEEINSYNQDTFRNQLRGPTLDQAINRGISQEISQETQIPSQGRRAQSAGRMPRVESIRIYGRNSGNQVITYTFSDFPMGQGERLGGASIFDNPILSLMFGSNNPFSGFLTRHTDGDAAFENLLNIIMQNDPNRYGSPPASQKEIKELKKEKIEKSNFEKFQSIDCSVCKENYKIEEEITTMPCTHVFHTDCLLPWLNLHNSCPVCRYELKTDDPDYENRKKELRRTLSDSNRNGQSNENNSNRNDRNGYYPRRSGSQDTRRT
jgi:E3 ubiquitin-protein ligase RNF115/126